MELPAVSPVFFENRVRPIKICGSSPAVSVPRVFVEGVRLLGDRRLKAIILRNYLIYVPRPFEMSERRQLLDIAMTALEALAMIDDSEEIREAWKKLKELEDRWQEE